MTVSSSSGSKFPGGLSPGDVIDDRYRVIKELGRGGMGEVYEAEQVTLKKRVALKILRHDRLHRDGDGSQLKRFLREARSASAIKHHNVVDIVDFGNFEDGTYYYVMELLRGRDLLSLLRAEGKLSWPRARGILLQVLRGLRAAHDEGIIHRDIKPANIFLVDSEDEQDRVKVLDFGIAKVEDSDTESQQLTGTSELLGTAAYMGPELAMGRPADVRTDLYAVGIVAYQLLTGTLPFTATNTFQVLMRQINDLPQPPRELVPEIPPGVETLVQHMLAKDPDDRYQTAQALSQAIRDLDESAPGLLPPSAGRVLAPVQMTPSWEARHRPVGATPPGTERYGQPTVEASLPAHNETVALGTKPPTRSRRPAVLAGTVVLLGLSGLTAWWVSRPPKPVPAAVFPREASLDASDPTPSVVARAVGGSSSGHAAGHAEGTAGSGTSGDPTRGTTDTGASTADVGTGTLGAPPPNPPVKARPRPRVSRRQRLKKQVRRRCRTLEPGTSITVKFTIDADGDILMPRALAPHSNSAAGKCAVETLKQGKLEATGDLHSSSMVFKL